VEFVVNTCGDIAPGPISALLDPEVECFAPASDSGAIAVAGGYIAVQLRRGKRRLAVLK
jgi:hypothetical protein